ncbi:MAG: F0F1 ATP synthase subunit gamma [Eubacteriales bacterium]|nr:F0F1 ATP synthase subunit gamma [Eubacteriales bacterium]
MNVRNVVKVMNFHSLLRVNKAKQTANKYQMMEEQLIDMIDVIMNNKNLVLDKKVIKPDENAPELFIYLGSDYGFCSNFNTRVNEQIKKDEGVSVLIGRKLYGKDALLKLGCEEFRADMSKVQSLVTNGIFRREFKKVTIVYNHYENTTNIHLRRKQIYPVVTEKKRKYRDDFVIEGNIERLLQNMIVDYICYEIMLADIFSSAGENLMRQNATKESLDRLDEIEERKRTALLKAEREKEFAKVIDSFAKLQYEDGDKS